LKFYAFLLGCIFIIQYSFCQPIISSFSPASGQTGSSVIINGSNFSATPSANIVYFGAVKAIVTSANTNTLTVTVPVSATYQPISVTTGNLTAYTASPFIVTDSVALNLSVNAFAAKFDSATDLHPNGIVVADFDGDGKPDLATANNYSITGSLASVSILRNTSNPGSISLAPHIDIPTGVQTYAIAAGDIDGDGKIDLVSSSISDKNITVFINNSVIGNISFSSKQSFSTGANPYWIAISDIDGDGIPDIVQAGSQLGVIINKSTPGNFLFNPTKNYFYQHIPVLIAIADLDGDGKADIVVSNAKEYSFSILRNSINENILEVCQLSDTNLTCVTKGKNYQWQQNNGTGFTNISNNSVFTGAQTASISMSKIPVSWNLATFRCITDSIFSDTIKLLVDTFLIPSVTINTVPTICAINWTSFTAIPVNGGDNPIYHWYINGKDTGTNDNFYFGSNYNNNDRINVSLTSNASCLLNNIVFSNTDTLSVISTVFPVSIITTADSIVCSGSNVLFTEKDSLSGTNPQINWYVNGIQNTVLGRSFSSNLISNNDRVQASVLVNDITCRTIIFDSSNIITMTVKPTPVAPSISLIGNNSLHSSDSIGNQWYKDTTTLLANDTSQILIPPSSGFYSVKTSLNGCSSPFSNEFNFIVTAVTNVNNYYTIKAHPNPAKDLLIISFNDPAVFEISVIITDENGKIVLNKNQVKNGERLDISSLSNGLYFLRLFSDDEKLLVTDKILKMN
jgi:hypothetical protein